MSTSASAAAPAPESGSTAAAERAEGAARPPARAARPRGARPAEGTQAGLRRLGAAALVLGTLTGVSGYALLQADAAEQARTASAQAATLEQLGTDAAALPAQARAAAGTGGRATATVEVDATLADLSRRLPQAAAAQPLDAEAIGNVNAALNRYSMTVQQARTQAAAGGAAAAATALQGAQTQLTSDVTTPLAQLAQAQTGRAEAARAGLLGGGVLFGASALATLGVLAYGAAWLAKRTHRLVNLPLTGGIVVALGVAALGAASFGTVPVVSAAAGSVLAAAANSSLGGPLVLLGGVTAGALARRGAQQRLQEYT